MIDELEAVHSAASATTQTAMGVGGGAVGLAAIGLVVWLFKRTFGHTIPRISADFKEALKEQKEAAKEARREFLEELRAQRQDFMQTLERIDTRSTEERNECHQRIEEVKRELSDVVDAIRASGVDVHPRHRS